MMQSAEIKFTASGVVIGESSNDDWPESPGRGGATNDGATVALTATFTRFLMGRPSLDEVTRFLVALLCAPVGALGAAIAATHGTRVETIAQYLELVPGWPAGKSEPLLAGKVADLPLGTARALHATLTDSELDAEQVVVIWPLGTSSGLVLTLVTLHATQLDLEQVKNEVKDFAQILAVYLSSPPSQSRRTRT